MQELTLTAEDGVALSARLFQPEAPNAQAVLICPAMGVSQGFYQQFAQWLASRGYLALTFDYRGIGRSRSRPLREVEVDVVGWARLDAGAALKALLERCPRVTWVGHSLGGQILPFVPGIERVERVVTVATGSGYWRENVLPLRLVIWWLWYVVVPVSMQVYGYFPGKRLRKVGDLPQGVMAQWRRWCLDPEYAAGSYAELYGQIRLPITSLSFTDDEFMSERNIRSLHGHYVNAEVKLHRFTPRELGVERVGHFGFFRNPELFSRVLP